MRTVRGSRFHRKKDASSSVSSSADERHLRAAPLYRTELCAGHGSQLRPARQRTPAKM